MNEKNEYNVKIGRAIARQRKKLGLSQSRVAEFLQVKKGTISRIENGVTGIDIKKIYQLHELFNCRIGYFFVQDGNELETHILEAADILAVLPKDKQAEVIDLFRMLAMNITRNQEAGASHE